MENQIALLNWLNYYDWIMGPDGPYPKPSEEILSDDEALDNFVEKWRQKFDTKPDKGNVKHFEIE